MLAVAAGYVALAKLSLAYFSIQGGISVAWLPGGMALALLLMHGKHFAWSVLLGEFAYVLLEGGSAGLALALGGANALAALVGAWLTTRRAQFDASLRSLQDFVRLIVFAGGVSGMLAAVIGTLMMVAFGSLAKAESVQHLLSWWIGNLVGILLITPLILIWRRPPPGWLEPWRLVEVCLLLALAFLVGQVIFLGWFKELFSSLAQSYWLFVVVAVDRSPGAPRRGADFAHGGHSGIGGSAARRGPVCR